MVRNAQIWLPGYFASRKRGNFVLPTHVFFCFVDHFEPLRGNASEATGRERVAPWVTRYPALAREFHDADGRPPQHTWFYPSEEYRPEFLESLAGLCRQGFGEVEIHLHHRNDTAANLRETLLSFAKQLRSHGLLADNPHPSSLIPHPSLAYAFIHGNWSLDNSRADGDWCGVNNELQVLRETGCYADFTLPSAPNDTQTRKVNSIYYATDDPQRPKSHDTGTDVRVGGQPTGDLMIVQGPLALNWRSRKWGAIPRLEAAEVARSCRATADRVRLWVEQRIGVVGKPDWVFVKVHTHGCHETNCDAALDGSLHRLLAQYNDGRRFVLHYVTTRELYNLVKAAEAGATGDPNEFRDFVLPPPPVRRVASSGSMG